MSTIPVLFVQGGGAGAHDDWDAALVASLSRELGNGYEVSYPRMPQEDDPDLVRWGEAVERELMSADDGVIAVGHSVGGTVLITTLADHPVPRRLGAVVLVAAPFVGPGGWPSDDSEFPPDAGARLPQGTPVLLFHGLDDDTVAADHAELYRRAVPQAQVFLLAGRDHQFGHDLTEVAQAIRSLGRTQPTVS